MKATLSKSAIARAAAAAALAALLAACGKSVTVTGGGGEDAPPTEERLFLRSGVPLPSVQQQLPAWVRERANWTPTAAERTGSNREYTDLVPVAERARIDPVKVAAAAGLAPSFAQNTGSYTRSAPYTRLSPDYGAFWQEHASDTGAQASRVNYFASSGVSQSSRGADGDVHDRVHVEIDAIPPGLYSDNRPTYHVELRYAGDPDAPGRLTHWSIDTRPRPYSPITGSDPVAPSWTGADGERAQRFSRNIPGGQLQLIVRTDRTTWRDTDWLATGMWWTRTTTAPYTSFGVFAGGGDPFSHPRFPSLAGTATYTGAAHGVFSHGYAPGDVRATSFPGVNVLFSGTASLTADFGDALAHGSVSGSVYGLQAGDQYFPGLPLITLGDASLGRPGAAVYPGFEGAASMTYAGEDYSGGWGGQFFGNAAAGATGADAQPSSAAGTFGVTAGEGSSLVGTFEVHR